MLYKYRKLDNFQYILDIIVNQRLYAATFNAMNDPMEGFYTSNEDVPDDAILAIEELMQTLRICSLTPHKNNPLMWAHYADGARGIAIGVEVKGDVDNRNVEYDSHSHLVAHKNTSIERAKNILTYKAGYWRYEDEARIFIEGNNYINVDVKEIIFGEKVDGVQKEILRKVIGAVNPNIDLIDWDDEMCYVHSEPVFKEDSLKDIGSIQHA